MKQPSVSVVMAVYNREDFFAAAAASIIGQSFTDFELIVVDDGSTDGTVRLIDELAREDPRVRVIRQPNRGVVAARNRGMDEARGRYIAVMDADDVAHPRRLELSVDHLESHGDTACVGSGASYIDRTGAGLGRPWQPAPEVASDFTRMPPSPAFLEHSSAMIRTSLLRRLGGYRPFFRLSHDVDLYLRLEEQGKIRCLEQVLVQMRRHGDNLSSRNVWRQEELAVFAMLSAIIRRAGFDDPVGRVAEDEIDYFTFKEAGRGIADVNAYAELAELRIVEAMRRHGLPMGLTEWLKLVLRYRLNARNRSPEIARRMAKELANSRFTRGAAVQFPFPPARRGRSGAR